MVDIIALVDEKQSRRGPPILDFGPRRARAAAVLERYLAGYLVELDR